jgi:tRNA (guanine37-N1)-methyltransferase
MHFDILTLFPNLFSTIFEESILKRAIEMERLSVRVHNIRDYTSDKHHITDDYPFGGGGGMVMKPEPLFAAVENVLGIAEGAPAADAPRPDIPIILLCPQGRTFTQAVAQELSAHERILLICGRYEGVDERVRQHLATDAISIGDYVLSGGELPAMILVEAVARLLPGVLGDPLGAQQDSFAMGLLEYPHYTRPAEFRGLAVPEVLLSGNHAEIARWRRREALRRTWQRRPDLLDRVALSESDRRFLSELAAEDSAGRE